MSLRELCREAVDKHDDPQKAIAFAMHKVEKDKDLLEELLQPIIASAIRSVIYDLRHEDKRDLKYPTDTQRGLSSIQATSGVIALGFLKSWVLPSGISLADATRDDLADLSAECSARATGELINSSFYLALMSKVPAGKRVSQMVSDQQAEALLEKIKENQHNRKIAIA